MRDLHRKFGLSAASIAIGVSTIALASTIAVVATRDDADPRDGSAVTVVPGGSGASAAWPGIAASQMAAAGTFRSVLYPEGWEPPEISKPAAGTKFLQDFSYAGFGRGETAIPDDGGQVDLSVAAPTGDSTKDTKAIQDKIDEACSKGGGVVNLQEGRYRVRPQGTNIEAISIHCSKLILRGKGTSTSPNIPGVTYIYNDNPVMRGKAIIAVYPKDGIPANNGSFYHNIIGPVIDFAEDTGIVTKTVKLASDPTMIFSLRDKVFLRTNLTNGFRADHGVDGAGQWITETTDDAGNMKPVTGQQYYRRIIGMSQSQRTITLDMPIRYPMKRRDFARVHKTASTLTEVGIEKLSIGNKEHPDPSPVDDQFNNTSTSAGQMHLSYTIRFQRTEHSWVRDVKSFKDAGNTKGYHLLSNGIGLGGSTRNITVERVYLAKPHFRGHGGNGYLYSISGMDHLLVDTVALAGRHNYLIQDMAATGNVLLRCRAIDGRYASDTHKQLSVANLYDSCSLKNDHFQSSHRQTASGGAGITGTQVVYWNTNGETRPTTNTNGPFIISSAQAGYGYVIGTWGDFPEVNTPTSGSIANWPIGNTQPADHQEGIGNGQNLLPRSLYLDQLAKRKERDPDW